jgi:hypothetical protein
MSLFSPLYDLGWPVLCALPRDDGALHLHPALTDSSFHALAEHHQASHNFPPTVQVEGSNYSI